MKKTVKRTFLKCILILTVALFSHNSCKGFLLGFGATYVAGQATPYVVALAALLTYMGYKKVRKVFFSKKEKEEKLNEDIINLKVGIDNLEKGSADNFDETQKRVTRHIYYVLHPYLR